MCVKCMYFICIFVINYVFIYSFINMKLFITLYYTHVHN